MQVLSLATLIETAAADGLLKKVTGNIQSLENLLSPDNLRRLEEYHPGVFAYMAFHPGTDTAVKEYVESGSLADDSNPNVLALFTLDASARWPKKLRPETFGKSLTLDWGNHPSYQLVRVLYGARSTPTLPGVVFFERFTDACEPVFLELSQQTREQVTLTCRKGFAAANESYRTWQQAPGTDFASTLALRFAQSGLAYSRAGRTSLREWLIQAFQCVIVHRGDIVAALKLIPLGRKTKDEK